VSATPLEAMQALLAVFASIDGLNRKLGPTFQIRPPALLVEPAEEFVDTVTMDGETDCNLTITVFVPYVDSDAGLAALLPYTASTGPKSVTALVDADPTLGGVVTDCNVLAASNPGRYVMGDNEARYYGVEFPVEVML